MQTQNMYSTGDVAKICGISVRTVQYYDNRELVVPSGISEGGRRLYSSEDLSKMKIVCFLRDLNIPINTVAKILKENNSKKVTSIPKKKNSFFWFFVGFTAIISTILVLTMFLLSFVS